MKSSRTMHLLAAAAANLLWSGSLIAAKLSYQSMGPMALGLLRFSLATVAFFALRFATGELEVPDVRGMLQIALTGILGTTLYFAAENWGVSMLPASTSSLIVGSFPAMTLVLECLIDHVRPARSKLVGVGLAFGGVALLALAESAEGGTDVLLGSLVLMAGGLCWALYNFAMRPVLGRYTVLNITCWQTLYGALGFIPFALAEGMGDMSLGVDAWLSLAYLVVGCTVAGFIMYNWALEDLEPSAATAMANLIPVFGLLLSALILHEEVGVQQVAGGAIVLLGIMLSTREAPDTMASAAPASCAEEQ